MRVSYSVEHVFLGGDTMHEKSGFATQQEAAVFIGINRKTLYRMIQRGEVDVRRYGRTVRIPWAWLHDQASNKKAEQIAQ